MDPTLLQWAELTLTLQTLNAQFAAAFRVHYNFTCPPTAVTRETA